MRRKFINGRKVGSRQRDFLSAKTVVEIGATFRPKSRNNHSLRSDEGLVNLEWSAATKPSRWKNLELPFERAARSRGQLDGVFRASLFAVKLERQLDQAINQLRVWQARGFPQLWIHADGREAGNRIEFVDEYLPVATLEKEIAPRHPGPVNRAE